MITPLKLPPQDKNQISGLKARMEELADLRRDHEHAWEQIAEYFAPRRDFQLQIRPGALRRRVLVDTSPIHASERLAALLHGYMMNPYQPWVAPQPETREPEREEAEWYEHAQKRMHAFLTNPKSTFRSQVHETIQDDVNFGNSVLWMGTHKPGAPPAYKGLPLKECFWGESDEGRVDVLYRRFTLTLRQALQRYPTPLLVEKAERAGNHSMSERIDFIHAVEPRMGGREGAGVPAERKAFASMVFCESTEEMAKLGGYDAFPYAVTRFQRRSGEAYGVGVGWHALPMAKLLNILMETLVRAGELAAEPPLVDFTGQLEQLDRRPGALNAFPASDLGLIEPQDAIRPLYQGGDVRINDALIARVSTMIDAAFYVDWMSTGDGAHVTAAYVNDRRDVRMRSMSPIVSRMEQEKLTAVAERTFPLMQAADLFNQPPKSLDGETITFEFTSPLAMAQRQSEVEAVNLSLSLAERMYQLKPESVDVLDGDQILRDGMAAGGAPLRHTLSPDAVAELRKKRAEQEQAARQAEQAEQAARAGRDAAQGLSTLEQGMGR